MVPSVAELETWMRAKRGKPSRHAQAANPKEIDELPLKVALGRVADRRNAARTRIGKNTT